MGGAIPFFVDWKKGFEITRKLVRDLKKPQPSTAQLKKKIKGYKQRYADYKRRGGSGSYTDWLK